ncbi:MAG: DUF5996 family protein [Pseudomonadales bacterium]
MMTTQRFPTLDANCIVATRDALHSYAEVLGDWLVSCRPRRKHWWQLSLRPSLTGLTTGMVHAGIDFELQLDLKENLLCGQVAGGGEFGEPLHGQPAAALAQEIKTFFLDNGIDPERVPNVAPRDGEAQATEGYSAEVAQTLASAWRSISAALTDFRAGIPEETSPIQLWPHHFDLAMMWLPGEKILGQDPADEEYSDKQMNFGFTLGDEGIPEPYFYVTAYPLPEAFPSLQLPAGTVWQSEGFSGAVVTWRSLIESSDPHGYLLDLWNSLVSAGRKHMLTNGKSGDA